MRSTKVEEYALSRYFFLLLSFGKIANAISLKPNTAIFSSQRTESLMLDRKIKYLY